MKKRREHNYLKKLADMWARGEIPAGVSDVEVAHDDWCRVYRGGYCNCDPDIRVCPLWPRVLPSPSVN